jgi:hypothetical protein
VESESAGDSGAARDAPILFISDASAEAERLTLALRARGYAVADVPLALLPGRVAVQRPALVLCDADTEGAVDALVRIRDIASDRSGRVLSVVSVVLVGERDGTIARIDARLVDAVFARPVNVQELVFTVERLVGVGPSVARGSLPPSARGSKPTSSSRPPGRNASSGPLSGRSVSDRTVRLEGLSSPSTAVPLPPDLAGDEPAAREAASDAPVVELSADIQLLLLAAERRLGDIRSNAAAGGRGDEPGPEVDAEAPLPPEVLVALEEPLDEEDESEKTGVPDRMSGGTAATGLGTNTGAPVSETSFVGTSSHGPRTSVHPALESERTPESLEPGDEDESRRARQQASTPRPPKPGPEDLKASAPPEPDERGSVPPPTAAPPAAPDPPSRRAWDDELLDRKSAAHEGTVVESRAGISERDRVRDRLVSEIEGEDRPNLTSTTPPLRLRDERGTDRPAPDEPPLRRESELPSSPNPGRRESDRQSRPPEAAKRETDRPFAPNDARRHEAFSVSPVLRLGDAVTTLAGAIRTRFSGAVAFEVDEGIRRVVLRDGDFVTAASGVHGEALVAFLASRGDFPADVARQAHKLPAFGRRAGAALIAHGHLAQDQLWPVLRAHAEWIIGRIVAIERGGASIEELGRLHDEPAAFGGATGAEVLVEVVRRMVPPEDAVERLGGPHAALGTGPAIALLGECALSVMETERVREAAGATVQELLEGSLDPSLASALYALVTLGVLSTEGTKALPLVSPARDVVRDEVDEQAFRVRILSRKALVDEGDYFSVLGVGRDATGYDIRRAYTTLRREFEPSRTLTAQTSDLGDVVDEIVQVLEEAYEILSDQRRRDRYRRAIEATP